jgi:hypothetical protein
MDTPPCSSARRMGWCPGGACAEAPSGGARPAGGFVCLALPFSTCFHKRDDNAPELPGPSVPFRFASSPPLSLRGCMAPMPAVL